MVCNDIERRRFVILFLNLSPTRVGSFENNSAAGSNIASMNVSKIRGLREIIFTKNPILSFTVTYESPLFLCHVAAMSRFCRKALPAQQWWPYCIATGPPSYSESSPVATSGGPYGIKTGAFPDKIGGLKHAKIFALEMP